MVVSSNGYGKRSEVAGYRITNRGGKGVKTINVTDKTGDLIAMKNVTDDDDLMIITKNGIAIRMHIDQLRVMGRATQGVKVINLRANDEIAAVAKVFRDREDEEAEGAAEDAPELSPEDLAALEAKEGSEEGDEAKEEGSEEEE